jgi:hypothetical protein
MTRRLQLTAADCCAATIGGLIGIGLALGLAESYLRRAARR